MEHNPNEADHDHARGGHDHDHHDQPAGPTGSPKVKDPVCGMTVDPQTAKYRAEAGGTTHFFCSSKCREKFLGEPARYLKPESSAPPPKPVPAGTIYTCPMHPQIRQVGPGNCPICGMTLEPV